jgi:ATP-dependent Lon protease
VILDEIDKATKDDRYSPTAPLYELLERTTASQFVDDGLQMPLNFSAVNWVATCNELERIEAPLVSRFAVFRVAPPTRSEMRGIASRMYRRIIDSNRWQDFFSEALPEDVLFEITNSRPRELERSLLDALGAAALDGRHELRVSDLAPAEVPDRRSIGFLPYATAARV